ncbi:MAG: hypothetical protein AAF609_08795 [Cyanobacteria bacterium P01_C01_bin.120]
MTSQNGTIKEESTPKSSGSTGSTKSTTKSSSRRQTKSNLVKAEAKDAGEVVFVLDDSTRIAPTEYLPNHRPIALSEFDVVGSLDMAGERPIMANGFEVATTDLLPGHRPVAVSNLPISDLQFLPGNRPIAPNDVVDPNPSTLMGYLD